MDKNFFNTTNLSGQTLKDAISKAQKQDERVWLIMKLKDVAMTPAEVYTEYIKLFPGNVPLTSIRRAISNLAKKGKLHQTGARAMGLYGRDNLKWKAAL